MKKRIVLIVFALACFMLYANANNLQISGVSVTQNSTTGGTVAFNIKWDNSWVTSATPNNWDAVWVFVKFRDCTAGPVEFQHGTVSTTGNTFNTGTNTLAPTKKDGTSGYDTDLKGVMLKNSSISYSGSESAIVSLFISNLPATPANLDVRVFGIEMVFVPQGGYSVGDGNGTNYSWYALSFTSMSSANFASITTEATSITLYDGGSGSSPCYNSGNGCVLAANGFNKGYNAFYTMKYEISQGQYADFLNAESTNAQTSHYPSSNGTNRHTLSNSGTAPNIYVASRPDRACNYLGWTDVTAYLDWAALRPLSEMEWEKAARGPSANPLEFAWGATSAYPATDIAGPENGSETITNLYANCATGGYTYTGSQSDGGQGPLRCGIFATATTSTRAATGGSYYGVMEMSGNVSEFAICARAGVSGGVSASGITAGDGSLDGNGNHNTTSWPLATAPVAYTVIIKGGSWNSTTTGCLTTSNQQTCDIAISNRQTFNTTTTSAMLNRTNTSGGRGGR